MLLGDSDRVVKLSALHTRDDSEARSFEFRLRSLAPAGTRTDDRLGERPPPPLPPGERGPGRRYVTHSCGYSTGGGIISLSLWGGVVLMALLVGVTLTASAPPPPAHRSGAAGGWRGERHDVFLP